MHCADSALVMPHTLMLRLYPYRRSIILGVHLLLISLGYLAAYAVRLGRASSCPTRTPARARPTFITGAREAGEQLLRQTQHDPRGLLNVVGLIDDAPDLHGRTLHGVSVVGGTERMGELVPRFQA